jgi:hypothetical protein
MQNRDGKQKGAQDHAEGGHGAKTRTKILEQLQSGNGGAQRPQNGTDRNGSRRLVEDRQQHDEGEKKSEKTRLNREVERGQNRRSHTDSEAT